MALKKEMLALSTVKTFNDLARRAAAKGSETLILIWKAGETAKKAKDALSHGEWMPFVEQHYDVSHKTVTTWMKFHETVPESKLEVTSNLSAAIKMLDPPKTSAGASGHGAETHHLASESCVADPSAGDSGEDDSTEAPWEEPQETGSRRRGSAKAKPVAIPRDEWLRQYNESIKPVTKIVRDMARNLGESESYWHEEVTRSLVTASQDMKAWANNWPAPNQEDKDTTVPPKREWVAAYIIDQGYGFTVDELFDYYEPRGWKPGKSTTKAKKWKPLCGTFERNRKRWDNEKRDSGKISGRVHDDSPLPTRKK